MSKYHFLGVCGQSMRQIAYYLYLIGHEVTGSDVNPISISEFPIDVKHQDQKLSDYIDFIVYNTDIPSNKIEEAKQKNIKVIHRAELLNQITSNKFKISITGGSGKTSTTTYIKQLSDALNINSNCFIGTNYSQVYNKENELNIVELNEADMKFTQEDTDILIFLNYGTDHIWLYDYNFDLFDQYFHQLLNHSKKIIYNKDDIKCESFCNNRSAISYGFHEDAHFRIINFISSDIIKNIGISFILKYKNSEWIIKTQLFTDAAAYHIIAAIIAIHVYKNIPISEIINQVFKCHHASQRFDIFYRNDKCLYIDDQALCPYEIENTLSAIRDQKVYCIIDPYRAIRSDFFINEFNNLIQKYSNIIFASKYKYQNCIYLGTEEEIIDFIKNATNICILCSKGKYYRNLVTRYISI